MSTCLLLAACAAITFQTVGDGPDLVAQGRRVHAATGESINLERGNGTGCYFVSGLSGTVIAMQFGDFEPTPSEIAAGLAREAAHIKCAKQLGKGAILRDSASDFTRPSTDGRFGPWSIAVRRKAIPVAVEWLLTMGENPVGLLTLFEIESRRLALSSSLFEGTTGGSLSELHSDLLKALADRGVVIARSKASREFSVRTSYSEAGTAFSIMGVRLFELKQSDAGTRERIEEDLNAFFDGVPTTVTVVAADDRVKLAGSSLIRFGGPQCEERAEAAAKAIRMAAMEYAARITPPHQS